MVGGCVVVVVGDHLSAYLGDRELRMPARFDAVMREVAGRTELRPRDLEAWLDPESAVVLVRRLVREGLFELDR